MSKGWAFIAVIVALVVGFLGAHAMFLWGPAIHGVGWGGPGMMARWGGPAGARGADDYTGYRMGPWMMGRGGNGAGYGPGMMQGRGWSERADEDLNLTVDQVKRRFERRLAIMGNDRVKLGPIIEKDANTITVDIVTTDKDGLVQRFNIDRKHGVTRPIDG